MTFAAAQQPVYLDPDASIESRVEDALQRMTLREKVAILHAQSKFSSPGVPRLGIPENWMSDGPHGIRAEVMWDEWYGANWTNDSCIAFPALTCLAATWNPDMALLYGRSIGEEARYRNKNVLLGPGVNIYRTPLNGRNFEYMGEDPCLASKIVVPYVKGVQQNGVAACVKHYALNNQEVARGHINVILSDRALYEIYLPAFKAAVQEGGAWAIMGAYNKYKGEFASHNQYLLNRILKHDWKFDGVVVSDWGATHNTEEAINNGLDMEFGSWTDGMNWSKSNAYDVYYLANPYLELLEQGKADIKTLDDKVRRVLRLIFRTTMSPSRPYGSFGSPEHGLAARTIAEQGIVLLKNNVPVKSTSAVLPVDVNKTKKILVVGENAVKRMTIGGGSSSLKAKYEISPLDGIKALAGSRVQITYVKGYESPAVKEQDVLGAKDPETKEIDIAGLRAEAVEQAAQADMVIFIGGLNKNDYQDCEGMDRTALSLPYEQDALIAALVKANPRTAVVIISGNAVAMPWVSQVPAIVEAWYSGSEAGNALARVLFGEVNPSGKLPFSFPVRLEDNSAHSPKGGEYPGNNVDVNYKDDIFVGYRWLEREKIKPLFAFGHGLSYTAFEYDLYARTYNGIDSKTPTVTLSMQEITKIEGEIMRLDIKVKNTGTTDGAEVVQLYISDKKSSLPRPVKELKDFDKVYVEAGKTAIATVSITADDLKYYDDKKGQWVLEAGDFEALVGSSSSDIRLTVKFAVK
ncbi:MAG: glycoside hydrolase family 3 C-terminal domain-containing protein [Bacteroidales bacterium]|nr:glycoside hydrolase family 3 C-terminal domain-containing protein [Bacteroidales bacterium]